MLGLPLVLVLPGYTFTAAAWPSLGRWGADKAGFTLASSIALAILGGLVLNFTPWGLERRSWAVMLAGITILAAVAAGAQRTRGAHAADRPRIRLRPAPLLLVVLAVLVSAAALGISREGALQADSQSKFTQLWMVPTSGKRTLQVGITNKEGSTERYRVVVRAGRQRLSSSGVIMLRAGRSWVASVRLPSGLQPHVQVEADLYRAAEPGVVYRHVTFWPS